MFRREKKERDGWFGPKRPVSEDEYTRWSVTA
jgi:hypothetical protein